MKLQKMNVFSIFKGIHFVIFIPVTILNHVFIFYYYYIETDFIGHGYGTFLFISY